MLDARIRVLFTLLDGEKPIEDILKTAGVSKASFHRVAKELIHEGFIQVRYDPVVYPPRAYYSLTEKGVVEVKGKLGPFKLAIEEEKRRLDKFLEILEKHKNMRKIRV